MQTNTEMRAISLPTRTSPRAPTAPATARSISREMTCPTPAHQRMNAFVGVWRSGEHSGGVGEWMPGETAVIVRWNQRPGDTGVRDMWVMTPAASQHTYALHRFDAAGRATGFRATVEGDVWTITGTKQRGTITFSDEGHTMTQHWQVWDGDEWAPFCDVTAQRRR